MNVTELRKAYDGFLAVADGGGFGPPPPGEWDAGRLLAHVASVDASIAAAALAVAAGERLACDNRANLDEWNPRRIVSEAGDIAGLTQLVRARGEVLCAVAAQLSAADLDVRLPVLIISADLVIVDEPRPLRFLVEGVGGIHLPRHAVQLCGLRPYVQLTRPQPRQTDGGLTPPDRSSTAVPDLCVRCDYGRSAVCIRYCRVTIRMFLSSCTPRRSPLRVLT